VKAYLNFLIRSMCVFVCKKARVFLFFVCLRIFFFLSFFLFFFFFVSLCVCLVFCVGEQVLLGFGWDFGSIFIVLVFSILSVKC